jgi:hypothetical protein
MINQTRFDVKALGNFNIKDNVKPMESQCEKPKTVSKVTDKIIKPPLQLEKSNSHKDLFAAAKMNRENISKNNFAGRYKSPSPMFRKANSKIKDKTTPANNLKLKFEMGSANSYQTPNKSEKKFWHP